MLDTPAYAAMAEKTPLIPYVIKRREPRPHDVLIDILYCGICHTDIHLVRNEWGTSNYPMVPGQEIIGTVSRVGANVTRWKVGDNVGVGCFIDSCRTCESCRAGEEQFCAEGMSQTYNGIERDGKTPTYGGYSTHITVNEDYVLRIPPKTHLRGMAPLLCAGITTYSPLKRHVRPRDNVAILGLGGLGHVAVKIAKAMGAKVTVISHSPKKRDDALALGADSFLVSGDASLMKENAKRFDMILDTVSFPHDYGMFLELLKYDRTMVLVGLPEPVPFSAGPLIMQRRHLSGSLIGGLRETQEMLDFCALHGIQSDVEVIPVQKANEAYDRVVRGDVRYRFVIDIGSLLN